MSTMCSVLGCGGLGGFRYPKDSDLRTAWITAVGRVGFLVTEDGSLDSVDNERICPKHFRPEDIVNLVPHNLASGKGHGMPVRALRIGAVPSIFDSSEGEKICIFDEALK